MAFVNELIPDEQKEKLPFPVKVSPFDGSKPTLWKWTIDRERDVYLVVASIWGGGYEGTPPDYYYVLSWKDELILFSAEEYLSGTRETDQTLTWKVHRLEIPESLQDKKEEVLQLIREALDAQGWLYNRDCLEAVFVEFGAFAG